MIKNSSVAQGREPDLEVNSGRVGRTKKYKYLGDKYNEK